MRKPDELEAAAVAYIGGVVDGSIVTGRLVRLAMERHMRDLNYIRDHPDGARALRFNRGRGKRAMWWMEHRLRFSKGEWAGKPFRLSDWQAAIVFLLFSWERLVDGRWIRRFRTAYLSMGRKQGKSELCAAIGLLMLFLPAESEPGAEIYVAATKRDQAAIVWRAAASMVRKSPVLRREAGIHDNRQNISHYPSEGRFETVSSESDTLDGLNPLLGIIDEYHAHPDSRVFDVIESGMGARREPLMIVPTTAGDRRQGACWDLETDAIKILEGIGEEVGAGDDLFAYIARLDEGDDWAHEAVWCLGGGTKLYARINGRETVTTLQHLGNTAHLDPKRIELWDGYVWVRLLGVSETSDRDGALSLTLRCGQRLSCTPHHEWPTHRGKVRASDLHVGDVICMVGLPDSASPQPDGIPPEVGWFVGLYLAEGSLSGDSIQLSGHAKETDDRMRRLGPLAAFYGGSVHAHNYGNRGAIVVESRVLRALLDVYLGGRVAKDKYLKPAVWRRTNTFLRALAEGYLEGDGCYEARNNRYRLGFCRNYRLADDLRTLAARLGAKVRLIPSFATAAGTRHETFSGEWRNEPNNASGSSRRPGEIMRISHGRKSNRFYHVGVDNADGLYALASGVVTHNSKANPNIGVSLHVEKLRIAARVAKRRVGALNEFLRKHMNLWTEVSTAWLPLPVWDACDQATAWAKPLEQDGLRGERCYVGVDLSSVSDYTAGVAVFPPSEKRPFWDLLPAFWIPSETVIERKQTDRVPVNRWVESEYVTATDGGVVDQDAIKLWLVGLRERYDVAAVPMDPHNATKLQTELMALGFNVVNMRQGWVTMSPAIKQTEILLRQQKIRHGGHPVLRWMFSNVALKRDANDNVSLHKGRSADRIDGIVALVMAIGIASAQITAPVEQDYRVDWIA
jgi:phage terminase large subunit-like protein